MSAATALTPAHTTMQGKFRLLWHLVAILVLVGIATLLVSGRLTESTLQAAQQDAFQDRFAFTAQRAATAAENALAMRIPLASDAPLAELLRREAGLEPLIQSFEITSAQGQSLLAAPISRVNSQGGADAPGRSPAPSTTTSERRWPRSACATTLPGCTPPRKACTRSSGTPHGSPWPCGAP